MQLIVRRIERDDEHIGELETQVRVFLEETEARLQALLTAYEPRQRSRWRQTRSQGELNRDSLIITQSARRQESAA